MTLPARLATSRKVCEKFCETEKPFITMRAEVLEPSTVTPSMPGSWKSSTWPLETV